MDEAVARELEASLNAALNNALTNPKEQGSMLRREAALEVEKAALREEKAAFRAREIRLDERSGQLGVPGWEREAHDRPIRVAEEEESWDAVVSDKGVGRHRGPLDGKGCARTRRVRVLV